MATFDHGRAEMHTGGGRPERRVVSRSALAAGAFLAVTQASEVPAQQPVDYEVPREDLCSDSHPQRNVANVAAYVVQNGYADGLSEICPSGVMLRASELLPSICANGDLICATSMQGLIFQLNEQVRYRQGEHGNEPYVPASNPRITNQTRHEIMLIKGIVAQLQAEQNGSSLGYVVGSGD